MKNQWKRIAQAVTLSTTLLASVPVWADEAQPAPVVEAVSVPSYSFTDQLSVQVLGVHSIQNSKGVELGAVVRIANSGDDTIRIPDHVLRLKGDDGIVYTLSPSSSNVHGVAGQSDVELIYYKQLNRQKPLNITDLSLVDVNYDVYPKIETTLVSVPVQTWQGGNQTVFTDSSRKKNWGEAFRIPTLKSPLTYTPANVNKTYTNSATSYSVSLLVENPGDDNETVPAFILEGKSKDQTYSGAMVESNVVLEPGEKKYIHFSIGTDVDTVLDSVNVVLAEPFYYATSAGQTKEIDFTVGQLNFTLPENVTANAAGSYTFGTAFALDPYNDFVNPNLQISLVELHATDSVENGYKTAIAKFKLENHSDKPIPVPALQTELDNHSGTAYFGVRQTATAENVQPGTSAIVSYGFILPSTESDESFLLKLQGSLPNTAGGAALRTTIASENVTLQGQDDRNEIHLYPYTLNIKSWILTPVMQSVSIYSYTLNLNMDLVRDPQVVLDNNFSQLKIELVDSLGSTIGTKYFPFTGTNRLVSGDQYLSFSGVTTQSARNNLTVKISESITTPNGEISRVLAELKP